jgi:hypothetical protein
LIEIYTAVMGKTGGAYASLGLGSAQLGESISRSSSHC